MESGISTPGSTLPPPPAPEAIDRLFPQYQIQSLVGSGGMGAVYRALHPKLDRSVAIKILHADLDRDPSFAERFEREARALAKLDHPCIVSVHDFGQVEGHCYLVMEFVDGANLRELLTQGRLSSADILAIIPQICDALQFAHDTGIVHRDIKPENILVDQDGHVRIADFGLAKMLGPSGRDYSLTISRQAVGTPHYMAPEQIGGTAVDHRADIYSLGVVIYEMITGELPIGRFGRPSEKAPDSAHFDRVVMKSLENQPDRRYQRVSDVKSDLRGKPVPRAKGPRRDPTGRDPGSPTPTRLEAPRPSRKVPWWTWLVCGLVFFSSVGAAFSIAVATGFAAEPEVFDRGAILGQLMQNMSPFLWGTITTVLGIAIAGLRTLREFGGRPHVGSIIIPAGVGIYLGLGTMMDALEVESLGGVLNGAILTSCFIGWFVTEARYRRQWTGPRRWRRVAQNEDRLRQQRKSRHRRH